MMRRKVGKLLGDRRVVGGFLLLIQLAIVMFGVSWASTEYHWLTPALTVLSVIIVIWLVRKYDNPMYKITWMLVIVLLPLFGGLFYLFWGNTPLNRARTQHQYEPKPPDFTDYMRTPATKELIEQHPRHAARARYIETLDGMPVWTNTETKYFRIGEEMFDSMCKELRRAQKFIFLEYFIIEEGVMWDTILDILREKAAAGLDVRVLYDDVGSICTLPKNYDRYLMSLGIHAVRFNRFIPTLNTYLNYRNHRKMTIIDGNVGYMGGINLADEYINKKSRFGHWKDTGIMLKGEAVWNLTLMFLQTWLMLTGEKDDYSSYSPEKYQDMAFFSDGYIQPYGDTPVDNEIVGENIYLNMINKAKHYVYITTPYLIIDNEMVTALTLAAKSGIDVRIITPGIPDKKLVYLVTQSYYYQLIEAGVRIFQYTPGFIHAKTVVVDDKVATVGTINFDYRSLYLHFECGVWMFNCSSIYEIKEDYMDTLAKCDEVTKEKIRETSRLKLFGQSLLRLVAPLM